MNGAACCIPIFVRCATISAAHVAFARGTRLVTLRVVDDDGVLVGPKRFKNLLHEGLPAR